MSQYGIDDVQARAEDKHPFGLLSLLRYHVRYRFFSGKWGDEVVRVCCERRPAVVVIPYDPWLDQVVMVEQFRIGSWAVSGAPWLLELVAGIIEEGVSPDKSEHK